MAILDTEKMDRKVCGDNKIIKCEVFKNNFLEMFRQKFSTTNLLFKNHYVRLTKIL